VHDSLDDPLGRAERRGRVQHAIDLEQRVKHGVR
jgi:hypothetical protein